MSIFKGRILVVVSLRDAYLWCIDVGGRIFKGRISVVGG